MLAKIKAWFGKAPPAVKGWVNGAEKAVYTSVTSFIPGAGLGYALVGDWRGLSAGLLTAAVAGLTTYWTKNSPTVAKP